MTDPNQPQPTQTWVWLATALAVATLAILAQFFGVTLTWPTPSPSPTPTVSPTPTPTPGATRTAISVGFEKPDPATSFEPATASLVTLKIARGETTGRAIKFTGPACISLAAAPTGLTLQLFQMQAITTTSPSYQGAKLGQHFDALVPVTQLCPTSAWYWLDVSAAKTLTPGPYALAVGDATLTASVLNFTLPDRPTMPMYSEIQPQGVMSGHGVSTSANVSVVAPLVLKYIALLRAHRVEPIKAWLAQPPVKADGTLDLDQWSGTGSFRQMVMAGAIAPVDTLAFNPSTPPTAAWLAALSKTAGNEAGLTQAWLYLWDEPKTSDISNLVSRAQLARQNAVSQKIMVTTEPQSALLGLVDNFTVVFEWFKQPGHWQDYTQAPGYWLYGGCMSHGACANGTPGTLTGTPDMSLELPMTHAMAYPYAAYELGAKATLYYNTTEAMADGMDPWANQYLFGANGDGTLVYPGKKGQWGLADDQAFASLRLKAIREGMNLAEYVAAARAKGVTITSPLKNQFTWPKDSASWDAFKSTVASSL